MNIVSKPSIGAEELQNVAKVFDTAWLGQGKFVEEFEEGVKSYLNAKHVIAVNTGTSAIHLSLEALGVGKGDEVIVPSLTFVATIQAITMLGATPVFCEVYPDDLNIDIDDVKKRITPHTKAILPVHYCGNICKMDQLLELAQEYDLKIIEDAAHAFGSTYQGNKVGSESLACCFSFDPIKNITCGEGGAIVTNDDDLAVSLKQKRILGINKDGWQRYNNKNTHQFHYNVSTQGYRYHMSNINAAIGLVQLTKMDSFQKRKIDIVRQYNEAFKNIPQITLLNWNLEEAFPFSYVVRVDKDLRDSFISFLQKEGVGVGIHYIPNHMHQYFQPQSQLPVTENIYLEIVTLPLYYDLSDEEVIKIIETILRFFDGETH